MSAGSRSGVNWMRWNLPARLRAMALPISVLPTPGMSSNSTCSPANSATTASRTALGLAEDHAGDVLLQSIDQRCDVIWHQTSIGGLTCDGKSCAPTELIR